MSTTAYERPCSTEYEAAATRLERTIEYFGKSQSVFDDIVIEAMRLRARRFREMALMQKARKNETP